MIKLKDIHVGMVIYNTIQPERGPGIIQEIRPRDGLGVPTPKKVRVTWANNLGGFDTRSTWCSLTELRRTPKS